MNPYLLSHSNATFQSSSFSYNSKYEQKIFIFPHLPLLIRHLHNVLINFLNKEERLF